MKPYQRKYEERKIPPDWRDISRVTGEGAVGYVVYKTIEGMNQGKDQNIAFRDAAEDENLWGDRPDIRQQRRDAAEVLKDMYFLHIDLDWVRQNI
jgi:hypothetical protein